MTIFSAATLLFLVMDPFGNIPIFLSILEPYDAARRLRIIARELSVMFIMSSDPSRAGVWAGAVFSAWFVTGSVLTLAVRFSRWLGRRGLTAIQRLMGMILTAIAINMMMTGIREFFAL